MNTNSKFDSLDGVKNFLNALNEADWKAEEISPDKIEQFVTGNLKIIANSQDIDLRNQLLHLKERVNREWKNDPQANNLAFEIMGIALGVFIEGGGRAPNLPKEILEQIFSHIPPHNSEIFLAKGGIASELEGGIFASKQLSGIASKEENKWAGEELVSLKKYGCKSAKDAIQHVINRGLTGANLSEFDDLEEKDLEILFQECPNLTQLYIQSEKITTLPEGAKALQTLICSNCTELKSLPEMPLLEKLYCAHCINLNSMPSELPQAKEVFCENCRGLQSLPKLPNVEKLNCSNCSGLQSLPDMPQVQKFDCSHCYELKSLSLLPQVKILGCNHCYALVSLPELPELQILYCCLCISLQNFPSELPKLQEIECAGCNLPQELPKFPEGVKINQ